MKKKEQERERHCRRQTQNDWKMLLLQELARQAFYDAKCLQPSSRTTGSLHIVCPLSPPPKKVVQHQQQHHQHTQQAERSCFLEHGLPLLTRTQWLASASNPKGKMKSTLLSCGRKIILSSYLTDSQGSLTDRKTKGKWMHFKKRKNLGMDGPLCFLERLLTLLDIYSLCLFRIMLRRRA